MTANKYIPGVCNIGPAEVKQQQRLGYIALAVTIVLWILLLAYHTSPWAYFLLIVPASSAAERFLQVTMHFCARFGIKGLYNLGTEVGKTETVEKAEFRAKDRKKAWEIFIFALIIGILVGLSAYLLVA